MHYYYYMASLPSLSMDEPPPVSSAEFMRNCQRLLEPRDWSALSRLMQPGESGKSSRPFIRRWRDAEASMQNTTARMRGARLKRDATQYMHAEEQFDASAEQAALDAFSRRDPAAREESLDRFRWRQIEMLAGTDMFSVDALFAYALKLRIAERWASFDREKGRRRMEAIAAARPGDDRNAEIEARNTDG